MNELKEEKKKLYELIEGLLQRFSFGEKIYGYPFQDTLDELEELKQELTDADNFYDAGVIEWKLSELEQRLPLRLT